MQQTEHRGFDEPDEVREFPNGRAEIVKDLAATEPGVEDVLWTLLVQFDLAPVGWAFALALVAGVFAVGRRLQRDTEGLV